MKNNLFDVKQWLDFADGDLRCAKLCLKDEVPANHTICFLCQGVAEKYLKALLITKGWNLKKEHDLLFLSTIMKKDYKIDTAEIQNELVTLNRYIVDTRYPGSISIEYFTEKMAIEAVNSAIKVKEFVLELV